MYDLANECHSVGPWNISIGLEGVPSLFVACHGVSNLISESLEEP